MRPFVVALLGPVFGLMTAGSAPAATVTVLPSDPTWFEFKGLPESVAQITATNPRSGNGSVELENAGALIGHDIPLGTFGGLNALSFEWFIASFTDPDGFGRSLPPELALRVYDFGDPRSFFLHWDTCSPAVGCAARPVGLWQSTNLIGLLSIQQAENNPPPASLNDIPLDAPITEVHLRTSFSFGGPWHGFVDNVTLGFTGEAPITYNFETAVPEPGTLPLLGAGVAGIVAILSRRRRHSHR